MSQNSKKKEKILRKIKQFGGFMFSDFSGYFEDTVIKTEWYWHKARQANGTEESQK